MSQDTKTESIWQGESRDVLSELLKEGAQKLLAEALEAEVEVHLERFAELRDKRGRRVVVRNGHLPERTIQSGIGASAGANVSCSAGLKMSILLGIGVAAIVVNHSIRRRTARTAKKMSNL